MKSTYTDDMIEAFFARFQSFQTSGSSAFKPGLERMEFVDQLAGHPHRKFRTIHVAGTNGKGSVSNMLASAMAATGLKVGLYTSPHILSVRERARVIDADGVRLIGNGDLGEIISRWEDTYINIGLSFFEVTTCIAFEWFAMEGVDLAVIETGLGGRMDSTNIITPEISVITNIGCDHCDILGNTLGEIAFEKAGIIKPKIPVVVGESNPETDAVFERKTLYTNLPEPEFMGDRNRIMSLLTFADRIAPAGWESSEKILSSMDLQGPCQVKNLRTVLSALQVLGVAPDAAVIDAIEHTSSRMDFHGRWERLAAAGTYEVIADIGHNEHGLRLNFARLSEIASGGTKLIIVYGSVADKDVDAVLRLIPKEASLVIFTNADNHRALPAEEAFRRYEACCAEEGRVPCPHIMCQRVASAVEAAVEAAGQARTLIYIGGSTYVVSEAVACF